MGGARPSLDDAIEAMFDGAPGECLVCSGTVAKRPSDGALVCDVCEAVLSAVQLRAAA